jgi:hypothetical protein
LNGKGNLRGAGGMKMAVARPSIVGCVAENAGFGRNCSIRSCTIADGGPAEGVAFIE